MSEVTLPTGWREVPFEELLVKLTNGTTTTQHKEPLGIPVSRIETISEANVNFTKVRYVRDISPELREKFLLAAGDILFSHINSDSHLGKCALFKGGQELLHGMNLLRMRVSAAAIPEFIEQYLTYLRSRGYFIQIAQHAVNQSSLNQTKINRIPIPLPPLAEQKRIVAKIEELFSELEAGEASLRKARRQLGVYRQSLLKQAFEGKLTQKWRTQNPDKLESPTALLARIQSDRQSRFEKQLKTWESSRLGAKPKKPAEVLPLHMGGDSKVGSIPDSWQLLAISSISRVLSGYAFKSEDFQEAGVPVIKIANIGYGDFVIKTQEYLPGSFIVQSLEFTIQPGDVLIALTRPITNNRTKVCEYPIGSSVGLLNQRVSSLKDLLIEKVTFFISQFRISSKKRSDLSFRKLFSRIYPRRTWSEHQSPSAPFPNNRKSCACWTSSLRRSSGTSGSSTPP